MLAVAHNIQAMNAQRQFNINDRSMAKTTEKLSSGYRINRAADDAAGLAISEKMRRQIRGLNQGALNIQDGISLCQVADGALDSVDTMLHRMNELSVQASNGTLTDEDRSYIQIEIDQLTTEINRIGSTTTFNDKHIFDKEEIEKQTGPITQLVSSPSAATEKLSEAYKALDGNYYLSASMDFSAVNSKNVGLLDGGEFSFTCPYGCGEVFDIKFTTGDEPSQSLTSLSDPNTHNYLINIKDAKSGADVVNAVYDYIANNLPGSIKSSATAQGLTARTGGVGVSHASALVKDGNKLIVLSNNYASSAANVLQTIGNLTGTRGAVYCSSLTQIYTPEPVYTIPIQCSSNVEDKEYITTRMMNAEVLTVDPLDVSTQDAADSAIDKVKYGMSYIAELRSTIGAQQNRLEHTYNTNTNVAENTQAAESQIRDTDMATEMVSYSLKNILAQAGVTMMSQANQSNSDVLSLLQ